MCVNVYEWMCHVPSYYEQAHRSRREFNISFESIYLRKYPPNNFSNLHFKSDAPDGKCIFNPVRLEGISVWLLRISGRDSVGVVGGAWASEPDSKRCASEYRIGHMDIHEIHFVGRAICRELFLLLTFLGNLFYVMNIIVAPVSLCFAGNANGRRIIVRGFAVSLSHNVGRLVDKPEIEPRSIDEICMFNANWSSESEHIQWEEMLNYNPWRQILFQALTLTRWAETICAVMFAGKRVHAPQK